LTREFSAGGVVLRQIGGVWHVALIEPQREQAVGQAASKRNARRLAFPKGLLDAGEPARAAAVREVLEECGIVVEPVRKLADTRYVYARTWGDGKRVFKIVSFYLMRYRSGEIDDLSPAMRVEVKRAQWVPLAEAHAQMAYDGERKVLRMAEEQLETNTLA
jgi:8-oxo-dGTP pyrophosphatase MutT (NUDIX family)